MSFLSSWQNLQLTSVVEGERKVDKCLFSPTLLARVVLLDDIVDLRNGRSDKKGQDEGEDVPVSGPEINVDRVEYTKQGESPVDRVDDDFFTSSGELENHGTEEKKVDDGPYVEGLQMSCGSGEEDWRT